MTTRKELLQRVLLIARQRVRRRYYHSSCLFPSNNRRQRRQQQQQQHTWPHTTTAASSYSSSSSSREDDDAFVNDGIVEGVWIFTRHGDRSPGRCLSPAHRRNEEAAFWVSKLPYPDSTTAYRAYSRRFPLSVSSSSHGVVNDNTNQGRFLDTRRNPFGFLSQTGLRQLEDSGRGYFDRYDRHARHMPRQGRWERAGDLTAAWRVRAYSTNYLRTVLSAQSFLDGLLGTRCFSPAAARRFDETACEERDLPDHRHAASSSSCIGSRKGHQHDDDDDVLVPVTVRELSRDPLNAFDRKPDLIAELVSEVMTSRTFQQRDASAAELAGRLANVLPGLIRPRRSDFSSRSPSGINWVEAADHFVCREAHGLPLSAFTDFEGDDRVEQTMRNMAYPTKTHLSWRFRQWYKNRRLLSAIAGPPFREILDQMKATTQLADDQKRPFTLYACHDITILGLLYGLGADFLADDRGTGWMWWPPYASTLALELVRCKDDDHDPFRVRVLLDGTPIRSVDFADPDFSSMASTRDDLLRIADFERVVERLEEDGGSAARL